MRNTRRFALVIAALAAGSFAGGAYVASHDPAPTGTPAFVREVAKRLNLSPEELKATLEDPEHLVRVAHKAVRDRRQ